MEAKNTPPDKPSGNDHAPSSEANAPSGSENVKYTGTATLAQDATIESPSYSSSTGGENALLVTGGEIKLTTPKIDKTGDETTESADFYGTNAAVLAKGGNLTITGGTIQSAGSHANAVFAYGDGKVTISDTSIITSGNNSGGIMVTGGGNLSANNLIVETAGNSSAAIRSDRGGGTMTVTGGSYKTSGQGSPVIYSTANVKVQDGTKLAASSAEGIVIEGSNSVTLDSAYLVDTNTSLNGNSETYKNIFIYQSMSGDAEAGVGTFTANNSYIETNHGDTFYVTNTQAKITLSNNQIINNDANSVFLRAEGAAWGNSGRNGGQVNLDLTHQVVEGNISLDYLSALDMTLSSSYYMGAINTDNVASSVALTLDAESNLILAGDSYLNTLNNADPNNQNIYGNGYKLFVNGEEVTVADTEVPEKPVVELENTGSIETTGTTDASSSEISNSSVSAGFGEVPGILVFIIGGILIALAVMIPIMLVRLKQKD